MDLTLSRSLRPKQAAEFLGIGVSTLWRWVKERQGFPQPIQLGPRTTVFEGGKLAAWRDELAQAPTSPSGGREASASGVKRHRKAKN